MSTNGLSNNTNPLQQSNTARINYLQNALNHAIADNQKARTELRNCRTHLSGMLKITNTQREDFFLKQRAAGEANLNEDVLRSPLLDAYHSQALYYNA